MRYSWKITMSTIILLLSLCLGANAQDAGVFRPVQASGMPPGIYVEIDPRVELVEGVLTFTSWMAKMGPKGPGNDYYQAIHAFFAPYAEHPAMKYAEALVKQGFTYGNELFALSCGSLPDLTPPAEGYPPANVSRAGGIANLEGFRRALVDLVAVSGFAQFISEHRSDYQLTVNEAAKGFAGQSTLDWMKNFYGYGDDEYHLVLAPTMFSGGYGINVKMPDGNLAAYQVLSADAYATGWPKLPGGSGLLSWSNHEWGHSFLRKALTINTGLITRLHLNELFLPVGEIMRQQAYDMDGFFVEQVLRAITTLAIKERDGEEAFLQELYYQAKRGFYLTPLLVQELDRYQANRNQFPTLKEFVPELFRRLHAEKDDLLDLTNQMLRLKSAGDDTKAQELMRKWTSPWGPALYFEYDSSAKKQRFSFDIEVLPVPGYDNLANISIEIDGKQVQLITRPTTKNTVTIDTMDLADGIHQLTISATDQNQNVRRYTSKFTVDNWTELTDPFSKPIESFFGTIDFSRVTSASEGWTFSATPQSLFGDEGRKICTASTPEYLVWEVPHLASYAVTLYVADGLVNQLANLVELAVSDQQTVGTWLQQPYDVRIVNKVDGWVQVSLAGKAPDSMNWFRLTLKGTAAPEAVQVGEIMLVYRAW